jgi:hypothetical protein
MRTSETGTTAIMVRGRFMRTCLAMTATTITAARPYGKAITIAQSI